MYIKRILIALVIMTCRSTTVLTSGGTGNQDEATTTPKAEAPAADADSLYEQGRKLLRGEGMAKDEKAAFELMQRAAGLGHAEAMGAMGYFHSSGTVVAKDDAKALEWFRKGAEGGAAKACHNLAMMLFDGKGAPANDVEGRKWLEKAANMGLPEAAMEVGNSHSNGLRGYPQDHAKAFKWFMKAAMAGNVDGMNATGVCYESGAGVGVDMAQAEHWLREAARRAHPRAQSNLGLLLGAMSPDRPRRIEALAWLSLAAGQNDIVAIKELRDVERAVSPADMKEARAMARELGSAIKPDK